MTTLADKAILSGADNRPPMLEKDMYDSWKRIMELYMMNGQHGRMILESVENESIQVDCDVKATNIILQGLPPEKGDDPIDAINHIMSFLTAVVTSCYPTTNNQLRNSSNPRQQATINDKRVTLQPVQGDKLLLLNFEILNVLDIAYHAILTVLDIVTCNTFTVFEYCMQILTVLDIVKHRKPPNSYSAEPILGVIQIGTQKRQSSYENQIMPPRKAPRTRTTLATTTTTTSVTNAQLQGMIDQGVTVPLAPRDANRNGDDSHTSGTSVRRTERVARECTYQDFMKCPTSIIQQAKARGSESTKFERYVGGFARPDSRSVVASKPKTIQEATKMATELMDKKISTLAERQAENKRKLDNNNQSTTPILPRRQNVQAAPQWAMYCKVRELQEDWPHDSGL
ncbi:hypothetical protein Tco_0320108 [Tanacetum coccineum]